MTISDFTAAACGERGRRLVLAVVFTICSAGSAQAAADPADEASVFIRDFGDEAIAMLKDEDLTSDERSEEFRRLLVEGFHMDAISKFVLGRHYRKLDEATRDEYQNAFEDFVVATYSRRLDAYAGETLEVGLARKQRKDFLVETWVYSTERPKIRVDWRVRKIDEGWKILDVSVEGLSMVVTQRSEFASVIQSSGGDLEPLLSLMRDKAATLQASSTASTATN